MSSHGKSTPEGKGKEVVFWQKLGCIRDLLIWWNTTLSELPLKHLHLQPLIKKHNLDPCVLSNFRPISKLPFLSKILEKVVYEQHQTHLDTHGILEKFQSGFKTCHSTETALLKVFNNLLLMTDSVCFAVLVLLDLTPVFDTVDHTILLSHLESCVGISGTALEWFQS